MSYRDDLTVLKRTLDYLTKERAELVAKHAELEQIDQRLRDVDEALMDAKDRYRERRRLPLIDPGLLEQVEIASPCSESWDEMIGNDRVRFCVGCSKDVYNVSEMTRAEAEAMIRAQEEGDDLCLRLYQRADGTIITADCSVGQGRRRRRRVMAGILLSATASFGGVAAANAMREPPGRHHVAPVRTSVPKVGREPDPPPPASEVKRPPAGEFVTRLGIARRVR